MINEELAARVHRLASDREPFVVATVVRARRPTSVRAGDCALITAGGQIEGFVGGVCAESTVRLYSLRALETGEPVLLRLVPGDPDSEAADALEGAVVEHNPCLSGGALEIFLEPHLPAPRMVIAGTSPIARALRKVASAAGYDVAGEGVGPGDAALVVASHGVAEEQALAEALRAGVPYVALVASRTRGEAVRAALQVPVELRGQLKTPAGLAIGARTPEEIAISILAEVVAERHAHPAGTQTVVGAAVSSATDPICGMEVGVTDATLTLQTDAGAVYFCGEHCRKAYAEQHAAP